MSWDILIFIAVIWFIVFREKNESKISRGGGPLVSFSEDPNSGLISFLDNEELVEQGIYKVSDKMPCGCEEYSYKGEFSGKDYCSECSDDLNLPL